jgi:hypothetical protein
VKALFVEDSTHRIAYGCAFCKPGFGLIFIKNNLLAFRFYGMVISQFLNGFAVSRTSLVHNHNAIIGTLFCPEFFEPYSGAHRSS